MTDFMVRWNFSNKLPSTLEKSRKLAASDPSIIYHFYDLLEDKINELGISNRPECIWNVDESNLFTDVQREKVDIIVIFILLNHLVLKFLTLIILLI